MPKFYVCLLGNWVCLNNDPDCKINYTDSLYSWWEGGAAIHSPLQRTENSFYGVDHVIIRYFGKTYRVHPAFIQTVDE